MALACLAVHFITCHHRKSVLGDVRPTHLSTHPSDHAPLSTLMTKMSKKSICKARYRDRVVASSSSDSDTTSDNGDDDGTVYVTQNRVYFYSEVTRESILKMIKCFETANKYALSNCFNTNDAEIYLYISSSGGCVFAGLSGLDHIRQNSVKVVTVCDGFLASSASFLFCAGAHRVFHKHSCMLVHQLTVSGFVGKFCDLVDETENSTSLMTRIKTFYLSVSSMTEAELDALLRSEKLLSAQVAMDHGFAHAIW